MIQMYQKEMTRLVVPLMPLESRELELNHNFVAQKSIQEVAKGYSKCPVPFTFLSNVKVFNTLIFVLFKRTDKAYFLG
jgi:hypothetical protein